MAPRLPLNAGLRSAVGSPVRATLLHSSPRSLVWRVELRDGGRVIVKQIVEAGVGEMAPGAGAAARVEAADTAAGTQVDAGARVAGGKRPGGAEARGTGGAGARVATSDRADARFAREVAALRLAARADRPPLVPALLGTDPAVRVMVLEHVADLGAAGDWLPGYAEALARLHALTGPADAGLLPAWSGPTAADAESFLALARALGVRYGPGVPGELGALIGRLDPPRHHALLHGDPCPGNDLHTGDGVRFVDFEQASLGNGVTELAYLRTGFPTCWTAMSVPGAALAEAEAAYRATWRAATGRDVPGDLADACAGWLIRGDALVERAHRGTADHLARVPAEDFTWGYVSARERLLHRLAVVADLARDHDELHELGGLCAALVRRLRDRWPSLRPLPAGRP